MCVGGERKSVRDSVGMEGETDYMWKEVVVITVGEVGGRGRDGRIEGNRERIEM